MCTRRYVTKTAQFLFQFFLTQMTPFEVIIHRSFQYLHDIKNINMIMPIPHIINPGTMKDHPHAVSTNTPATIEPRIFPTLVWLFQTPMIKPRL